MATVCVGCGLTVTPEGKLALETPEVVSETVGSGVITSFGASVDVAVDTPQNVGPELSMTIENPSSCRDMLIHVQVSVGAQFRIVTGEALLEVVPAGASEFFPTPVIGAHQATGSLERIGVVNAMARRVSLAGGLLAAGDSLTFIGQARLNCPTTGILPMHDGTGGQGISLPAYLWSLSATGWLV
jgi:hypothetical protein